MKDIKEMSYNELSNKIISNRAKISSTKSLEEKRQLINENHDMMTEIDRRWNSGEIKTIVIKK